VEGLLISCTCIEMVIKFAVEIVKEHCCCPLQGIPPIVSVSIATVTGCPGGCRLCVQLSCHAQGHNERDTCM
jgi:hypothetical protein